MPNVARSSVALAVLGALVLAPALPAAAAVSEWGTPVTLSAPGQNAFAPVVVNTGTTVTAVWARFDGTTNLIQAAYSTDGGRTWPNPPVDLSTTAGDAFDPVMVTDGTTVTAAWSTFNGTNDSVQVASSADGGRTWTSPPVDLSPAGQSAYDIRLVTDGTTITAAWIGSDGSNDRIQAAFSTDRGGSWTTASGFISPAGQNVGGLRRLDTDGTTIAAIWTLLAAGPNSVQVATSVDGGANWSATPATLGDPLLNSINPDVVVNGSTITAVWTEFASGSSSGNILAAVSTNGGVDWSSPVDISAAPGQNASSPQLITEGSRVTAVWTGREGLINRIQTRSSTDGGATWSTPLVNISPPGQSAFNPRMVTDGTTITAAWVGTVGSNGRILVASSTDGGATWSTPPVNLSAAGQNASNPQLARDGTTITAVWTRSDGSNPVVQVSSFLAPLELADTGAADTLTLASLAAALLLAGGLLLARVTQRGRSHARR